MENKLIVSTLLACLGSMTLTAQVAQEKEWIKEQCGCFEVTFDYQEVFPQQSGYTIQAPYHASAAAEWVFVVEEGPKHVIIQHLLVVADTMVVKHWRQDWHYEKEWLTRFDAPMDWKKESYAKRNVKGTWTQTVYQVDDSPRYAGVGRWVPTPQGAFWEATSDAPLPRREYTKRSDYNVMVRRNRHEIHAAGWVHEQDNLKVKRHMGDTVLVGEKGYNRYTQQSHDPCEVARAWWTQHGAFWNVVRTTWDRYLQANPWINEAPGTPFYKEIAAVEQKFSNQPNINDSQLRSEIEQVIQKCYPQSTALMGATETRP
jgi:hypothetical protein